MIAVLLLVSGVVLAGNTTESYNMKRALEAVMLSQDYQTGIKYLVQEVQENPTNGIAYAYLAIICDQMSGYDGATFRFAKQALKLLPKSATYLKANMESLQAELVLQAGDTVQAIERWNRAISYNPSESDFYGPLANVLDEQEDYQALYEMGDRMLNRIKGLGSNAMSYIVYISSLNSLQRYDEALRAADLGVMIGDASKNEQATLHYLRGQALIGLKRYPEALTEAMATEKLHARRGLKLMVLIADSSDIQPVLDSMETAFSREPNEMLWPCAMSDVYARHNQYIPAVYHLLRGAKTGDDADSYRMAGSYVQNYIGDAELAEELYRKSMTIDSTSAEAWGHLADLYYDLGRYDEALRALDEALRLDPEVQKVPFIYSLRGRIYRDQHNYPRAVEEYRRSLVAEHDRDTWTALAEVYRRMGDEAAARRVLEQGLQTMRNDTAMDMLLALGDTVRARQLANKDKMVRRENSAGDHYNAACMFARMNMPDEALRELKKAFEYGFRIFHHIAWDDDLDSIRQLPEFTALIEEYKALQRQEIVELKRLLETL